MAGKKGRSGRKPRTDGKVMKAVSLYIEHTEIDTTPFGKSAKYEMIPDAYFRKFKRYFGVRWQDKIRWAMSQMVKEYQDKHIWRCRCTNDVVAWHKKTVGHCDHCNYTPSPFERYKSYAEIKINEQQPKVSEVPIDLCPVCKDPLQVEETKWGKSKYCKKCNPKRSKL